MPEPGASLQSTAIRHSFAEVNDVRLHYASAGTGRLIMFLHGFPEFWYEWKDQLADFGRDSLAVAPDLRGYNLSSKPADVDQYQLKFIVEDVRALCEHLGHERCILVGHDWGGVVAWVFAAQHPEHVEKLVIINAPHPAIFDRELRENPTQQQASQYMLIFRSSQAEQLLSASNYSALADKIMGFKQAYFTDEDRRAYFDAWSQPEAITGGLNYYRAAQVGPPGESGQDSRSFADQLGSLHVRVPTLVIWGEKDVALPTGNLQGLERFVSNLQIRRVADGSHWIIHEQPRLVNSFIRDFIENRV